MASRGLRAAPFVAAGEALLRGEDAATGATDAAPPRDTTHYTTASVSGERSLYAPSPAAQGARPAASLLLGRLESNRYAVPDDLLPADDLAPVDEEEAFDEEKRGGDANESRDDDDSDNGDDNVFGEDRHARHASRPGLSPRRARAIRTGRDNALVPARTKTKTFLSAGPSAEHPLRVDHDEEVHLDGARLVWTSGGVVRFRATFEEPAEQAAWCAFPDERGAMASRERRRALRRARRLRRALRAAASGGDGRSRSHRVGDGSRRSIEPDDSRDRDRWMIPDASANDARADDSDGTGSSDASSGDLESADLESARADTTAASRESEPLASRSRSEFEWFRGCAHAPTLCVRLRGSLFTHAPGGETRTAPLPRDALGDFFPCALGLLVRTRRGVFALRHPLDEPAPVVSALADLDEAGASADALASETRSPQREGPPPGVAPVPSPAERVAWSSADSLYFLTHDPTRGSHALWRVAPAPAARRDAADAPFDAETDVNEAPRDGARRSAPSRGSVAVERVWREPAKFATRPTSFAGVAHDDDARATPRLCVLGSDGVLRGYHLRRRETPSGPDPFGLNPPRVAFAHERVATAAAVKATRAPLLDAAFVTDEGGMALACGARVAIKWRADTPLFCAESEGRTTKRGVHLRVGGITRLHSPVGSRVTAEFAPPDGETRNARLRLALPGAPVSPATRALAEALGGDAFGHDASGEASRAEALEIVLSAAAEAASPEDEFDRAQASLLAWCGCEGVAPGDAPARVREAETVRCRDGARRRTDVLSDEDDDGLLPSDDDDNDDDDDDDAWAYLLRSERHASEASRYPSMAASAAARWKRASAAYSAVPTSERTPRSERAAPRLSAAHVARAMALLRAAHAAYESCKLDVLRRPCLVDLRGICVRAATACASQFSSADPACASVAAEAAAFLDHHARDAWFDDSDGAFGVETADDAPGDAGGDGDAAEQPGIDRATARLAASVLARAGAWAANAPGGVAAAPDACAALESLFSESAEGGEGDEGPTLNADAHCERAWRSLVPPLVRAEMVPIHLGDGRSVERADAARAARATGVQSRRSNLASRATGAEASSPETMTETKPGARSAGPTIRWAAHCVSFAAGAAACARAARRGDFETARALAAATAEAMVSAGFGLAELARVPSGLALRLRDCLRWCRERPPPHWPPRAYALVGRDDLAAAAAAVGGSRGDETRGFCAATGASCLAASPSLGALDPRARLVPGDGDDGDHRAGGAVPREAGDGGVFADGDAFPGNDGDDAAGGAAAGGTGGAEGDFGDAEGDFGDGGDFGAVAAGGDAHAGSSAFSSSASPSSPFSAFDGMAHVERFVGPLLFSRDRRLREARALLASAAPASIALGAAEAGGAGEGGDPEVVVAQQARLWSLAPRTAALALGRGAFTLGTARARRTERIKTPPLTLAGRLPAQRGAVVALDLAAGGAAGAAFARWPEFHNGVASGLALSESCELTRAWIVFNRPKEPSATHAGVLLALGLRGHLTALTNTDLYRYLVQEHDATTVAALLGVAAARRGTARADAAKMCFLHLPAIHPSAFPEVELSLNAQSAALAAVGLIYQGTAHRRTVEIALAEIGRDPGVGAANGSDAHLAHANGGREGYALSAGFALGLVTLGRGADAVGLADLRVLETLRGYLGAGAGAGAGDGAFASSRLAGSVYASHVSAGRGASGAGSGAAYEASGDGLFATGARGAAAAVDLLSSDVGGGAEGWSAEDPDPTLFDDELDFFATAGANLDPVPGLDGDQRADADGSGGDAAARGGASGHRGAASTNGQTMSPGSAVNVDATSPGAALALGLMFLRTGDAAAAASLDLPSTHYALDHVRPDFVLTRVVAKALIMWHEVEPTIAWMETRLPPLLRPPLSRVAMSAFFDAERHGERGAAERFPSLGTCFDAFPADDGSDREALAQAHVHALAGACMALGLRFAGTADASARDALRSMLFRFLALKAAAAAGEPSGALVDRPTAETCVCVAATALACVMAGTGDVETFRVLRRLRARVDAATQPGGAAAATAGGAAAAAAAAATGGSGGASGLSYGAHATIASAIGFLFLGGGTMTFATDNASVAALWMATYPRFPQNASDNRCHLQAFRHLYALAARRRLLRAVDAAAGVSVTAPVEMRVRASFPAGSRDAKRTKETTNETVVETVIARTPCLLPDPSRLVSLRVVGDRYWPVSVADARGLEALYQTRTLPVQRLAGALPYASDPTGARAGAAASLDVVRARAALVPPPRGSATPPKANGDLHGTSDAHDAAVRASDARRARSERVNETRAFPGNAAGGDDASPFGSDPASAGFARLMCARVPETSDSARSGAEGDDADDASAQTERAALASFCRAALRECARREEPDAAAAYVDVYAAARATRVAVDEALLFEKEAEAATSASGSDRRSRAPHAAPSEPESARIARALALADARLLAARPAGLATEDDATRAEASDAPRGASPFFAAPVVPRALASSFLETARDALDAMRFDAPRAELAAYYAGHLGPSPRARVGAVSTTERNGNESDGKRPPRGARAGVFGAYLRFFGFPTAFAVRRALAKFGLGPPGSGLDPEAVAVALAVGLPGTDPAAALRVARCGL